MVCKLSKCMDKANMSHYKALLHAAKYIFDKKMLFIPDETKIKRQRDLGDMEYNDVNQTRDIDTRKLGTVYIVIVNRSVITWHS